MISMVVFASNDGTTLWHPRRLEELPDWVLDPDIMAALAAGLEVTDTSKGPAAYRAVVVDESDKENPKLLYAPFLTNRPSTDRSAIAKAVSLALH